MKEKIKKWLDLSWDYFSGGSDQKIFFKEEKPFKDLIPNFLEERINQAFLNDNNKWMHSEFISYYQGRIIVEPDYGYCIKGTRTVLSDSVFYPGLKPSLPCFWASFFKNKPNIKSAILFDGKVGLNYFHFFSDVLHKLWLIEKFPALKSIPLIVSEEVFNKKFFQFFYSLPEIRNYNWLVQKKGEYISLKEVYLLHPMPYAAEYFKKTKKLVLGETIVLPGRRVFLNRSEKSGRNLANFDEILPILNKYGFEVIDTDGMELIEQATIFAQAKHLIAIHGAGNTNILFSDKKLRFLEIMPTNRLACQYFWLANALGIEYYDVITGGDLEKSINGREGGFFLDKEKLKIAIERLLIHCLGVCC